LYWSHGHNGHLLCTRNPLQQIVNKTCLFVHSSNSVSTSRNQYNTASYSGLTSTAALPKETKNGYMPFHHNLTPQ
jgi:hypothetical protein